MKRTAVGCLVGVILLANAAMSRAQTADGIEKAIAALEQQWLQSQKTNNVDLVAPLLADKFVSTSNDGKITNRAQALAATKASKYTSQEYEDVKVTVFGDTAIATGVSISKGTDASGKPMATQRWTDTWVKMSSGKWQCVASHNSRVAK